jgi:L-threonylcarbamoyladenylate synthase
MNEAVEILRTGGIIVFPTDTAYGLGCDFQNQEAIQRILKTKGRTDTHFTIVAGSLEQVKQFFTLNEKGIELAKQYWPGPLSIVVDDQFSVRVPDNDIARQLATTFGKPIIATSANISKRPAQYTLEGARNDLGEQNVDLWIDGGDLQPRLPSTVVDTRGEALKIIRQGGIQLQ